MSNNLENKYQLFFDEVIPLKYGNTESFSEGLAAVQLNHKWGFINKSRKKLSQVFESP